jgi:hypothetical protein
MILVIEKISTGEFMNIFKIILLLILFISGTANAQGKQQKFQIDFNEIKGALTSSDLMKKDFGRYHGFEIELFQDESINFVVYSKKFQPGLALINSKGEVFKQSMGNLNGFANLTASIPTSGNWILYVLGNEKALGDFTLQTAIAEPNALTLDKNADICTILDFLLSHANAYFLLLENKSDKKHEIVKLDNAIDAYLDEDNSSYDATIYDGTSSAQAEGLFKTESEKITACLGSTWKAKSTDWEKIEDYKMKSLELTEQKEDRPRYLIIAVNDRAGSKQKTSKRFQVKIEIGLVH